jgi:hypothetical protein
MTRTTALKAGLGAAVAILIAVVAVMLASRDQASTAGPLQSPTAGGQQLVDDGGLPVSPGQSADVTAYVINTARRPVTLVSVSVIAVPGFARADLAHTALASTLGVVGIGSGWPPDVPIKPFAGAVLQHGQTRIVFGITGSRIGDDYAAAGLRVSYKYQGQTFSVTAWAGVLACVTKPNLFIPSRAACGRAVSNRLTPAVEHMSGS